MVIDELESANKFPDRGEVRITREEVAQQDQARGSNVALRLLLKEKGVPMCGSSWPAYHPDFFISLGSDGTTQVFRWIRRSLMPDVTRSEEDRCDTP